MIAAMRPLPGLEEMLLSAWKTNSRASEVLIGRIPAGLWAEAIPGSPRRTVRSIGAHIHNARCVWIRTLGSEFGVEQPNRVDKGVVTQRQLVAALKLSSRGISSLLALGLRHGGSIPPSRAYVWRNLPLDVAHVLTYFVAHEAHHRGQIVMVARQLNRRLPAHVVGGLWQFRALSRRKSTLHMHKRKR